MGLYVIATYMILGDTYLHRVAVTWVPWRLKSLTTQQFVQQVTKGPQCGKYFHDMARSRLILLPSSSSVSSPIIIIIIIVIATIFIAVIITIDHRSSSRMITNFAFMNSLWRSVYNKQRELFCWMDITAQCQDKNNMDESVVFAFMFICIGMVWVGYMCRIVVLLS